MNRTVFPEIHTDRLQAVLAHIEANPTCWKQSSWHCGSSHCFGGWAQVLSGTEQSDDSNVVRRDARLWLGLTYFEANALFAAYSSLDDLRTLVAQFCSAGYNRDGYNRAGYDRDGYDRAGYDRAGYSRAGYNRAGYDRAGYDRDGYDRAGYDRDGWDEDGLNLANEVKPEAA